MSRGGPKPWLPRAVASLFAPPPAAPAGGEPVAAMEGRPEARQDSGDDAVLRELRAGLEQERAHAGRLLEQLEAVGRELATERERSKAESRPALAEADASRDALRAELAQERSRADQLLAQLRAVGQELAAERGRNASNALPPPARPLVEGADPEDAGGWNALGHQRMAAADYRGAAVAFAGALRLLPDSGDLWLSLGHALSAAGDGAGSNAAFHRCLSTDLDRAAERRGLAQQRDGFVTNNSYVTRLDPATLAPPLPGLYLATLPKTGTVFIRDALCQGLRKRALRNLHGGLFPQAVLGLGATDQVRATGGVLLNHCGPSAFNRAEVSHRLDRMVVHVRDPRQNLISWAHFMPAIIGGVDPVQGVHLGMPEDFTALPAERQMDWYVDHLLPEIVGFIAGWLDAPQDPGFRTRMLYTTQEELAADQDGFFDRVLAFHDIDPALFVRPPKPKSGELNFRQGRTDEWRSSLTPAQQERVSAAIPERLLDRFGWPRR